jgi:hypothetical protein
VQVIGFQNVGKACHHKRLAGGIPMVLFTPLAE